MNKRTESELERMYELERKLQGDKKMGLIEYIYTYCEYTQYGNKRFRMTPDSQTMEEWEKDYQDYYENGCW